MIKTYSRGRRLRLGPVEREVQRILRAEKHRQPGDRGGAQRSSGETAEQVIAHSTVTGLDEQAARGLVRGEKEVIKAARRSSHAGQHVTAVAADPVRPLRETEHTERHRQRLTQRMEVDRPLVSGRFLALTELVLLLGEGGFWIQAFSRDIDSKVPWYGQERLAAYILAVLLPLLGVVAARWTGATWQRLLRHPAPDRQQRRNQRLGAAAALGLLMVVTAAIFSLVRWRFGPQGVGLGGLAIPATWMALAFGAIIVADAIARAFLVSEQAEQDRQRDAAWIADRCQAREAAARRTDADAQWAAAWLALRRRVNTVLNRIQQAVDTGEWIVVAHRATDEHGPDTLVAPALVAQPSGPGQAGLLLPEPTPSAVLDLPEVPMVLRGLRSAVDTLAHYQPPSLRPEDQVEHLTGLLFAALATERPAPAGPSEGGVAQSAGAGADRSGSGTQTGPQGKGDRPTTVPAVSPNGTGPHGPGVAPGPLTPFPDRPSEQAG
ncbi:hypothetical protein ACWGI8_44060 [Streptomyces sp. NPDC054841]